MESWQQHYAPMTLTFAGAELCEGIQELGVTELEELLLDRLYSFLTAEVQKRLRGWHLGLSF